MRLIFAFIACNLSFFHLIFASSACVKEQCALVDAYLDDPRLCQAHMKDYALQVARDDPFYAPLVPYFEPLEGLESLSTIPAHVGESFHTSLSGPHQTILRAYATLHLAGLEAMDPWDTMDLKTLLWALFLSRDFLLEENLAKARQHPHPIVLDACHTLDRLQSQDQPLPRRRPGSPMACVKIVTLVHPHHVFEREACLYALGRGVHLLGLSALLFTGHGGLFPDPVLMVSHDRGHLAHLIDMEGSLEEARRSLAIIGSFSRQMLTLAGDEKLFASDERDLALYIAFLLVRETIVHAFTNPYQALHPDFEGKVPKELNIFAARGEAFGLPALTKAYGEAFARKGLQDLAEALCDLAPQYKDEIMPGGVLETYDVHTSINAHVKLTHWLEEKVLRHMRPLARFDD